MNGINSQPEAELYVSRSRSLRIGNTVTSVRLENIYWEVLAEIAMAKGLRTSQLIQSLSAETAAGSGKIPNLASRLRVTCLRYVCLKARGQVSIDDAGYPRSRRAPTTVETASHSQG